VLKIDRYVLTSHWCRHCGVGRILMVTNSGPTGGGNPIFHCTHCDKTASNLGCESLCYCGWNQDNGMEYMCWTTQQEKIVGNGWKVWSKDYSKQILRRYV
jgi:hypothetical protein